MLWARSGAVSALSISWAIRFALRWTVRPPSRPSVSYPCAGPNTLAKLIEDKANGSAVIQMLARELPGLLPVTPEGGKVARAAAVSPLIEAGNIYLPHPQYATWVDGFIEECAAFPNGAHDDQVDAMTQALLRWNTAPTQTVIYLNEGYQFSPI